MRYSYNQIHRANLAIIGFNSAKAVNPIPLWDTLKKLTQAGQELINLQYKKKILNSKYCTSFNKYVFTKSFPFKTTIYQLLTRGPGGLALLKKKKDTLKIVAFKNITPYFSLHAHYIYQQKYQLKKTYEKKLFGSYLDSLVQVSFL